MSRGIAGITLFQAVAEGEEFLGRTARLATRGHLQVCAWALMPTHFQLLLQTGAQPLAISMRLLLTGFTVTFTQRHKRR